MFIALAISIGILFSCALYLMMQRSLVRWLLGLVMIGHGANLAIFTAAGLRRGVAPLVEQGQTLPPDGAADPLPQALVLTAIVIGFALASFGAVLAWKTHEAAQTDDIDQMRITE